MSRSFLRWLFEDRITGRLVVAQMPNLLAWLVLLGLAAGVVLPAGRAAAAARIVKLAALALWALDELARGVNPWRRLLGAGTLVGMAIVLTRP